MPENVEYPHIRKRVCGLLRWSVLWVVGWIAGLWFGSRSWLPFPLFLALLLITLIAGSWWLYRKWNGFRVFIVVTAFLGAAAYMTWVDDHNRSVWSADAGSDWEGQLTGRIISPLDIDGNRVQFTLQSEEWENRQATFSTGGEKVIVRLYLEKEEELEQIEDFRHGDRVRMPVELERPQGVRNPGGFDYRQYLYHQHIHWIGNVVSFGDMTLLSSSSWHWLRPLDQFRQYLGEQIDTVYSEPAAGLVRGMILGERDAVDLQVERQFATLGLLHLLAISGLHVGIVLALCYGGMKWAGMTRERAAAVALLFLPFYALLTGAAPPVIRAALVGGLVLIAVIFRQWKDSLHFLALAAAVMLLWNPYWMFTASFQLSFIITLGIIVGVPPLSARIPLVHPFLKQTLAITLVAQFCSFPLIIYYFNEFSLLSGLANFIVVPLVSSIVIPISFVTVILAAIAVPLAALPAKMNAVVIDKVLLISDKLAVLEPLHLVWATPSILWMCTYYALLSAIYVIWLKRSANIRMLLRFGLMFAMIAVLLAANYPYPWWNRPLTVTFLDVGQGDAIVIETPQRRTIVVDAGGKLFFDEEPWQMRRDPFDVGEDIVLPFLRHKGVRTVDYLVMSHGDADHIGGMQALVENVPVRYFVRGPDTPDPSEVEQNLLAALRAKNVPVYRAVSGTGWELEEGLYWQFVQPDPERIPSDDRNAQSVVLRLSYKGRSLLLTGDADQAAEKAMLGKWNIPPVDLLKAGHHGSDTSTGEEWLREVRPKVTVLSVGENNRYNHPHPDVVERLRQAGSKIYRTDHHGGIVVRIDSGGRIKIEQTVRD